MADRAGFGAGGVLLCAAASAFAGCGGGDTSGETAELRAKLEAQSTEIDALKKAVKDQDARFRLLEEKVSAVGPAGAAARHAAAGGKPAATKPAAPGAPADPGSPGTAASEDAAPSPSAEAVASYLDTEAGRQKIRDAMQAEEKRRAAQLEQDQHDRMVGFIKERVTGTLAEQLGLDSNQQQTVITVATDAMDKVTEIWRGARDARGDASYFAQAREKTLEVRQQAMDKLQQSLSVDQYNKLQDIMNEGGAGMLFGGAGGRGIGGMGGGGQGGGPAGGGPAGGAPGGAGRGGNR